MPERTLSLLLAATLAALVALPSSADPLVEFVWPTPPTPSACSEVDLGATSLAVDLSAYQSGGADAAYFTLGITWLGIVTDVELIEFGPAVSVADSYYDDFQGTPVLKLLIASAPSDPGSFGVDVDLLPLARLNLRVDMGLGSLGSVALVDLTAEAGAPALAADGATAIPSDLGGTHCVPEAEHALSVLTAVAILAALRLRRAANCSAAPPG